MWFTDASSHRENNKWKYKAVALEVATGEKLIETGEGSAQVRELRAVLLAAEHGATHIYTHMLFLKELPSGSVTGQLMIGR